MTVFSKDQGDHRDETLVAYQTGYHVFTLPPADHRSWRIGQPHD